MYITASKQVQHFKMRVGGGVLALYVCVCVRAVLKVPAHYTTIWSRA